MACETDKRGTTGNIQKVVIKHANATSKYPQESETGNRERLMDGRMWLGHCVELKKKLVAGYLSSNGQLNLTMTESIATEVKRAQDIE